MLNESTSKIIDVIYKYFPADISYNSFRYKISKQNIQKHIKYIYAKYSGKAAYWHRKMRIIFDNCEVVQWTDFETGDCYQYKVLLHENHDLMDDDVELILSLGGERKDLRIYISVLGKFYIYYVVVTKYDNSSDDIGYIDRWEFSNDFEIPENFTHNIKVLEEFMEQKGYRKVTQAEAEFVMDNLETEYIKKGKVRVFDCIFTQIDGL